MGTRDNLIMVVVSSALRRASPAHAVSKGLSVLYNLFCFFRDLPPSSDKSMSDVCALKLSRMHRFTLTKLRDDALEFVRVLEAALQEKGQ